MKMEKNLTCYEGRVAEIDLAAAAMLLAGARPEEVIDLRWDEET